LEEIAAYLLANSGIIQSISKLKNNSIEALLQVSKSIKNTKTLAREVPPFEKTIQEFLLFNQFSM
jgi:hypothetical protein